MLSTSSDPRSLATLGNFAKRHQPNEAPGCALRGGGGMVPRSRLLRRRLRADPRSWALLPPGWGRCCYLRRPVDPGGRLLLVGVGGACGRYPAGGSAPTSAAPAGARLRRPVPGWTRRAWPAAISTVTTSPVRPASLPSLLLHAPVHVGPPGSSGTTARPGDLPLFACGVELGQRLRRRSRRLGRAAPAGLAGPW